MLSEKLAKAVPVYHDNDYNAHLPERNTDFSGNTYFQGSLRPN
jgi:hypothetical protein